MNIFEGIISEVESDHVVVKSEALESDIYITSAADVPLGASVGVAIRPEKMLLSLEEPKTPTKKKRNYTAGEVAEIAYLGDMSIYHIRMPSDQIIKVSLSNQVRLSERPVNWGDQVYLSWDPQSGSVLTVD